MGRDQLWNIGLWILRVPFFSRGFGSSSASASTFNPVSQFGRTLSEDAEGQCQITTLPSGMSSPWSWI